MDILTAVTARLLSLGYAATGEDSPALDYQIAKAESALKAGTNQAEVPDGLFEVWADMAAGRFLSERKASGRLDGYDFDAPAKSISEGDTSITFALPAAGTAEDQFDAMLSRMINPGEHTLAAFRRIAW